MTDREMVITHLDDLRLFADVTVHPVVSPDNWNVYSSLCDYIDQIKTEVEILLKEQEPRVMKLEDVKAFGWDYCYLEEERLPGKEYRTVCGDYALTCITWPCIASMRIQYGDDSYGKKWRCWSAKPTEEQMKEVPWK